MHGYTIICIGRNTVFLFINYINHNVSSPFNKLVVEIVVISIISRVKEFAIIENHVKTFVVRCFVEIRRSNFGDIWPTRIPILLNL